MFGQMRPRHDLSGQRVPIRGQIFGLGQAPRDVVPCPKGPATSSGDPSYPEGAARPGQGRRYTLVDYITGELIKDDVGDEIWSQYSVTSLPDEWVCEDPRCKPYCGQAAPAPEQATQQCPEGQVWTGLECKPLPAGRAPAACASKVKPGMFDLYEVSTDGASVTFLRTVPASVDHPEFPDEPASMASPGFCDTHSPTQAAAPEPEPAPAPSPPEPSAPMTPAPIPTTPVTQLSPPQAGFQTPCNPGRPTQMGRARMSRDFFGRSMF